MPTLEELIAAAESEVEAKLDKYEADLVEQLVSAGRANEGDSEDDA